MADTVKPFSLTSLVTPLSLAALLAVAGPAFAQDTTTETPAEEAPAAEAETPATPDTTLPDLDMGEATGAEGDASQQIETYVDEVFGDWQRECLRIPGNEGPAPCQITQFLREEPEGAPVGKVSIGKLPDGNEAVAGSMVIVPLGVLLTQQITVGVDAAAPKRYPFRFCDPNGCVAQIGYTSGEVDSFMKGNEAIVTVVPTAAPDQKVELPLSLSGFTDAWNSLEKPAAQAPAQ
ncbi:invasion associated locus B family protein [Maritimibacter sp. DP1N21-5]|uniref:invasion associated locus B family protein n=1 Tax=Maritimibacter sp. DP1N21-5 TaxID=2836867 RepID=UPI001C461304|nr:invasion associated locus B family protein [Maritimibacter sp. DP1N21-5]MBV7409696.1 invasion associated locus B family protein [Maritimibacter sp. DP1N21-5]